MFHGKRERTETGVSETSSAAGLTGGRTRREIAEDLGVGLAKLTRRPSQERNLRGPNATPVDLHAELTRLQRESAARKPERDILKKAAAFFARE